MLVNRNNQKTLIKYFYKNISYYKYNQYFNYPSKIENAWESILKYHLDINLNSKDVFIFDDMFNEYAIIVNVRISKWDREHFGFPIANISILTPDCDADYSNALSRILDNVISFLQKENINVVFIRINGDDIKSIHCFEEKGFKYYEDVIWPVYKCKSTDKAEIINLRLMKKEDIESVTKIASTYQYQRGHFHCDMRFNIDKVNSLYGKWVETAFINGDPIVILEFEKQIVGYFVLKLDKELSTHLGYSYGRMKSLAIDSSIRGKGLGKEIFKGAINKLKEMGAQYIDSGYSTKNHISAKLHTDFSFYSVYEEVTFHKWLK